MVSMQTNILYTERLLLRLINPEIYNQVMSTYDDGEIKKYFGFTNTIELEQEKARFRQGMSMSGRSFLYFHLLDKKRIIAFSYLVSFECNAIPGYIHRTFAAHKFEVRCSTGAVNKIAA